MIITGGPGDETLTGTPADDVSMAAAAPTR